MAGNVIIYPGWIKTTDQVRTRLDRLLQQISSAGIGQDARLWKRHSLNIDQMAMTLLQGQYGFQPCQPDFCIDIGMTAAGDSAIGGHLLKQLATTHLDRQGQGAAERLFGPDSLGDRASGNMGNERHADQRLIQMHMTIDKARQGQTATRVDPRPLR